MQNDTAVNCFICENINSQYYCQKYNQNAKTLKTATAVARVLHNPSTSWYVFGLIL